SPLLFLFSSLAFSSLVLFELLSVIPHAANKLIIVTRNKLLSNFFITIFSPFINLLFLKLRFFTYSFKVLHYRIWKVNPKIISILLIKFKRKRLQIRYHPIFNYHRILVQPILTRSRILFSVISY